MPTLATRGPLALAAVLLAVLSAPRSAPAQVVPPPQYGGFCNTPATTGAWFEMHDEKKAVHRLEHLDARLQRQAASGNAEAAQRTYYKANRTRFRIGVDEWLIRYNSCQQLTPYPNLPCIDPVTCAALANFHGPAFAP